jgi:hypothetical protein
VDAIGFRLLSTSKSSFRHTGRIHFDAAVSLPLPALKKGGVEVPAVNVTVNGLG